jgi:hypothetical protein
MKKREVSQTPYPDISPSSFFEPRPESFRDGRNRFALGAE